MSTTETVTLSDFLLARIAEDEWDAKPFVNDLGETRPWIAADVGGKVYDYPDSNVGDIADATTHLAAVHIARWHPARVLAECEAKRQIVEQYVDAEEAVKNIAAIDWSNDQTRGRVERAGYSQARHSLLKVLLDLALPYADHESFKEEWRP